MKSFKTKLLAILMAAAMVFAMAPLTAGVAFADDENAAAGGVEATETDVTVEGVTEEDVTEEEAVETDGTEEEAVEEVLPGDLEVKGEARATGYNLWVGNTQVSDSVKSGSGWKYSGDASKGTLTLTKASINTYSAWAAPSGMQIKSGILSDGVDLTIVLSGENSVDLSGVDPGYAVLSTTKLTIKGPGSLTAKGSVGAIYGGVNLVIQDAKVKAEATSGSSYAALGTDGGNVTIKDSNVTVVGKSSYAIVAEGGVINIVGTTSGKYNTRVEATVSSHFYGAIAALYGGDITFSGVKVLDPSGAGIIKDGNVTAIGIKSGELWEGSDHVVIGKATNTLKVSGKTATVKYKKVKKSNQTLKVTSVIKFSNKGKGTLTYAKASGNKKITVNKKTGKVTVKKGLKKGKYTVKIKVTAAGSGVYGKLTKTVTCKIRVK